MQPHVDDSQRREFDRSMEIIDARRSAHTPPIPDIAVFGSFYEINVLRHP
jgi:hypothetical protein